MRWTLELLAGALVKLTEHAELSRETVRRRLAENDLKPWRRDMWWVPQVDGNYVARMEDVLDLYAEAPDPKRPVVCFDESPTQLIGEVRQPILAAPGQPERYDCEYRRNGTVNLCVFLDAHRPWRKVKVTAQRAASDFAECMRELVDLHYTQADLIRFVLDNLSTHSPGALAPNGCLPLSVLAPRSHAPTRIQPKSHNLCAELSASFACPPAQATASCSTATSSPQRAIWHGSAHAPSSPMRTRMAWELL